MPLLLGLLDDALHRCEDFGDQDTLLGVGRFRRQSDRGHKVLIEISLHLLLPFRLQHSADMPMGNKALISLMFLPCLSYQLGLSFLHIICIKFHLREQVSLGVSKSIDPRGTKSIAPSPQKSRGLKIQVGCLLTQKSKSKVSAHKSSCAVRSSSADMKSSSSPYMTSIRSCMSSF